MIGLLSACVYIISATTNMVIMRPDAAADYQVNNNTEKVNNNIEKVVGRYQR